MNIEGPKSCERFDSSNIGTFAKKNFVPVGYRIENKFYEDSTWRHFLQLFFATYVSTEDRRLEIAEYAANRLSVCLHDLDCVTCFKSGKATPTDYDLKIAETLFVHVYETAEYVAKVLSKLRNLHEIDFEIYVTENGKAPDADDLSLLFSSWKNEGYTSRSAVSECYLINERFLTKFEKLILKIIDGFKTEDFIGDIALDEEEDEILRYEIMYPALIDLNPDDPKVEHKEAFALGLVRHFNNYYYDRTFWPSLPQHFTPAGEPQPSVDTVHQTAIKKLFFRCMAGRNKRIDSNLNDIQHIGMFCFVSSFYADSLFDYCFRRWEGLLNRNVENLSDALLENIARSFVNNSVEGRRHTQYAYKYLHDPFLKKFRWIISSIDSAYWHLNQALPDGNTRLGINLRDWIRRKHLSSPKLKPEEVFRAKQEIQKNRNPYISFNFLGDWSRSFYVRFPEKVYTEREEALETYGIIKADGTEIDRTYSDPNKNDGTYFSKPFSVRFDLGFLFSDLELSLSDAHQSYKGKGLRIFEKGSGRLVSPDRESLVPGQYLFAMEKPGDPNGIPVVIGGDPLDVEIHDGIGFAFVELANNQAIRFGDDTLIFVGPILKEGLIGSDFSENVIYKNGIGSYEVCNKAPTLLLPISKAAFESTRMQVYHDGQLIYSDHLPASSFSEVDLAEGQGRKAHTIVYFDQFLQGPGSYQFIFDFVNRAYDSEYKFMYLEKRVPKFADSLLVGAEQAVLLADPNSIWADSLSDYETTGDGNKYIIGLLSDDENINDGHLSLNRCDGTKGILELTLPVLYWKFNLEDGWRCDAIGTLYPKSKSFPKRLYIRGPVPYVQTATLVYDLEDGIPRDSLKPVKGEGGSLYFEIERLNQYGWKREFGVWLRVEGQEDQLIFTCQNYSEARSVTLRKDDGVIIGKADIDGGGDYVSRISHHGEPFDEPIDEYGIFMFETDTAAIDVFEIEILEVQSESFLSKPKSINRYGEPFVCNLIDVKSLDGSTVSIDAISSPPSTSNWLFPGTSYRLKNLRPLSFDELHERDGGPSFDKDSNYDAMEEATYYEGDFVANGLVEGKAVLAIFGKDLSNVFVLNEDGQPLIKYSRSRKISLEEHGEEKREVFSDEKFIVKISLVRE